MPKKPTTHNDAPPDAAPAYEPTQREIADLVSLTAEHPREVGGMLTKRGAEQWLAANQGKTWEPKAMTKPE